MSEGWISLHRKMLEWEWYSNVNVTRLFIHLLLKANHKDKKWRGILIKRGQLIAGRKSLSKQTGLSEQNIRTALNKLKSTNELTIEATREYSVITINNYGGYQDANQRNNQQLTNHQPTSNQPLTTNNNVNNVNNVNKEINPLRLTKRQITTLLKEFPNLSRDIIKEQSVACNDYMVISSANYSNPGLFFRGWLKKVHKEKLKSDKAKKQIKRLRSSGKTAEELERNKKKLAEIRKGVFKK